MMETFQAHPDLYVMTHHLKHDAMRNGHRNPEVTPSGDGLLCGGCGGMTRLKRNGETNQWEAQSSPAHRLHIDGCN